MNKLRTNQKVKVYYNNLTLGNKATGHIIHEGCPSVDIPWRQATEYSEKKISTKEWSQYLIPELNSVKCLHEHEAEVEVKILRCPNGCSKEAYDENKPEGTGMFRTIYLNGLSSPPEHICIICGEDGEIV